MINNKLNSKNKISGSEYKLKYYILLQNMCRMEIYYQFNIRLYSIFNIKHQFRFVYFLAKTIDRMVNGYCVLIQIINV